MITKKRATVLKIRTAKRAAAKAERAAQYAQAKDFALANPTPKLEKTGRLRSRTELQIVAGQVIDLLRTKTGNRLGLLTDMGLDTSNIRAIQPVVAQQMKMRSERNDRITAEWIGRIADLNAPKLEIKPL